MKKIKLKKRNQNKFIEELKHIKCFFSYTILGDNMALKGIVIDPGHGGSDPGALGNDIKEKDYTLAISKYMYDRFKELGVPVSMTRTTDSTLSPSERTKKAQSFYGDGKDVLVISNHLNAGGGDGAEVIYSLRNNSTLSKMILDELAKEGQNIRKYYQLRLPSNSSKDYYFMLRDTPNNESVIVEYGFLDSTGDDVEQIKRDYEKYAEAVVRAVANYKNIPYTPVSGDIYIVKKGDTLWDIARKYGMTVNELKELNNLSSNLLKIGQTLKIKQTDSKEESEQTKPLNTYTVQKGDNLYSISNKYNTSVDELKKINNLSTNIIQIGQVLKIPSKYSEYTVKKGDTLWAIARDNNTSVSTLTKINNLKTTTLQIGQKLLIPN
jgi:LysM repeat protein